MALQDIPPMKTKTLLTGTLSWLTTIPASYFVVADQLDYTHTLPTRGVKQVEVDFTWKWWNSGVEQSTSPAVRNHQLEVNLQAVD